MSRHIPRRSIRSSTNSPRRLAEHQAADAARFRSTRRRGFDPREEPVCDASYWVDNLRNTVRFAAAVRAALEDGLPGLRRAGTASDAHPRRSNADRRAVWTRRLPLWPSMRREQALPHGLRGLVADLHSAGAAVDFSVLYPEWSAGGRAAADLDPPSAVAGTRRVSESSAHGGRTVSVHPLLGPHVRLPEEPERHVWQAEVGTAAQPWLADHTDPQCRGASRGGLLRDGAGRRARSAGRGCRGPRHPLRAGVAAR